MQAHKIAILFLFSLALGVGLLTSCSTTGTACETDLGCARGEICLKQICAAGCRGDLACPVGLFCVQNQCSEKQCQPGTLRACFDGNLLTVGIGICRYGVQFCSTDGSWSGCSAQISPMKEACDRVDNDCNGKIDDGLDCQCKPGIERACYTGPAGTRGGDKPCKAGIQTCLVDNRWGPCRDQRLPEPEICGIKDNDCDGSINNDLDCSCTPGEVRDCYSGPTNTNGVGNCQGGKQTCQTNNTWSECQGQVTPQKEQPCDKQDNDCNGIIDDVSTTISCDTQSLTPELATSLGLTPTGIALGPSGLITITGTYTGSPKVGNFTLKQSAGIDAFYARYNADMSVAWVQNILGAATDVSTDIHVSSNGNFYITGYSNSEQLTVGDFTNENRGNAKNGFLGSFTPSGKSNGLVSIQSTNENEVLRVASYGKNVFILGRHKGKIQLLNKTAENVHSRSSAFLCTLGQLLTNTGWCRSISSMGIANPGALTVYPDAQTQKPRIAVGGTFQETVKNGNSSAGREGFGKGIFITTLDGTGAGSFSTFRCSAKEADCQVRHISLHNGTMYFTGHFETTLDKLKSDATKELMIGTKAPDSTSISSWLQPKSSKDADNTGVRVWVDDKYIYLAATVKGTLNWPNVSLSTGTSSEVFFGQFDKQGTLLNYVLSESDKTPILAGAVLSKGEMYFLISATGTIKLGTTTMSYQQETAMMLGKIKFPQ